MEGNLARITINGITIDPIRDAQALAAANLSSADASGTPVRLAHRPTRCRVVPVARIKLGIGRRLCVASDA